MSRPSAGIWRRVSSRIWSDERFIAASQEAQIIFLHIITHKNMTQLGILEQSPEGLAADIRSREYPDGIPAKRFRSVFDTLCHTVYDRVLIQYDPAYRVIAIPNHFKHCPPDNPKHLIGILRTIPSLPNSPLIAKQIGRLRDFVADWGTEYTYPIDTVWHTVSIQGEGEGEGYEEGKEEEEGRIFCSEPVSENRTEPNPAPVAVAEFPCKANKGQPWILTADHIRKFRDAYPGVDVRAELKKARVWLEANPVKQKTPRGMYSFLNRWLAKANDSGRASLLPETTKANPKLRPLTPEEKTAAFRLREKQEAEESEQRERARLAGYRQPDDFPTRIGGAR